MKLSDIKPGMEIKYRGRVYGHRNLIGKQETRTGTVWYGLKVAIAPTGIAMTFRATAKFKIKFASLK